MIILRRLGKQNSDCRAVIADPISGTADGINQVFTVSYEYTPGRIEIIYNGQVLKSSLDFEETGPSEITFNFLKPTQLDLSLYSANYEIGDCGAGQPLEPAPTNFIALTDTPNSYAGHNDHFVKVNSDGSGLEFVPMSMDSEVQEGVTHIPQGVYSIDVSFDTAFSTDQYTLTVSLENRVDSEPSVYPILIKGKSTSGFTVDFSGDIDSDNYYLNWRATSSVTTISPGSGSTICTCSGIEQLYDDKTPELGGDLEVSSNLLMLDPYPYSTTVSGGYVRGYSGEASKMFVADNSATGDGFGAPLYMRPDGKWATCTAVSGTNQMPCMALAIEPGDGGQKKILWRGIVRKGEWSWTPGKVMYVSTVEGAITDVKPNNGHWKQPIGIAIQSDTIRFDPGFNPGI